MKIPIVLIFLTAVAIRLPYIFYWDLFYISDHSYIALVAKHLLRGEYSIYCMAGYHGMLEPLLIAPFFKLFGSSPQVASLVSFSSSLIFLGFFYGYIKRTYNERAALFCAALLALPSPLIMSITMRGGDYIQTLCFGVAQLWLYDRSKEEKQNRWLFFWSGIVAGFCWYNHRLILLFWLAIVADYFTNGIKPDELKATLTRYLKKETLTNSFLFKKMALPITLRAILVLLNIYNAANFIVAALLWVNGDFIYAFGNLTVKLYFWPIFKSSLLMFIITLTAANYKRIGELLAHHACYPLHKIFMGGFLIGFLPAVIGLLRGETPDSRTGIATLPELFRNINIIGSGLIPELTGECAVPFLNNFAYLWVASSFVCAFIAFGRILLDKIKSNAEPPRYYPLLTFMAIGFFMGLIYEHLIDRAALRYLFPIYLALPLGMACLHERLHRISKFLATVCLALFCAHTLLAHRAMFLTHQEPHPYRALIRTLEAKGIKGGYANYRLAYCIDFLSDEKLTFTPTDGVNRYPRYTEEVRALKDAAWVNDSVENPAENMFFSGIRYQVTGQETVEGLQITYLKKT